MKAAKRLLCILAAAAFMLSSFRTGCRIIVNGKVLPGIHDPISAQQCAAAAQRTAEEITRTAEEPPFILIPVLCLTREEPNETVLYHTLLEAYDGVGKFYTVSVDGKAIGMLGSLWEVSALMREYPSCRLEITTTYSHAQAGDSLPHVRAVLRQAESDTASF